MASVCFYFQLHQPLRLRRYSVFESIADYLDHDRNRHILRRVAHKCYLPATKLLLEQIRRFDGRFRLAFSLTGTLVEQCRRHEPEVIEQFVQLAETGCVEFLNETYHHSLAFLYSKAEFDAQVDMHANMIEELFGQSPRVFRNTELIYSNELADYVAGRQMYRGIIAEGVDHLLGQRSPNHLYHPPGHADMPLLLKNYRLSDDIAFRFSTQDWREWPLTAEKYAGWLNQIDHSGDLCGLFIDFETFGEHQWAETGIFEFLRKLPELVLANGDVFHTPGECIERYKPQGEYDAPSMISWADSERDLSAWIGNAMQSSALNELYKLEKKIKQKGDELLLADWRNLTASDHFYYMCTKFFADGDVHKYFNPYESPYDSYINFMNVLDHLRTRLE